MRNRPSALSKVYCVALGFCASLLSSPGQDAPLPDLLEIAKTEQEQAAQDALQGHLNAVGAALQAGDLGAARKAVDQALALAPEDERVLSLNAAVLTYERKLGEARKIFSKLLEKKPDDFALNWNLAEVDFLEGNYYSARQRFLKLREPRPKDEMLTYKILLTHVFEGKTAPAQDELERIPFPSDTAAYYYGRAAIDLWKARELKKEGKEQEAAKLQQSGLGWMAEAGRIFRLQHNLLFADSLIEKKLISREQVTGLVPVPEPQQPPELQ